MFQQTLNSTFFFLYASKNVELASQEFFCGKIHIKYYFRRKVGGVTNGDEKEETSAESTSSIQSAVKEEEVEEAEINVSFSRFLRHNI